MQTVSTTLRGIHTDADHRLEHLFVSSFGMSSEQFKRELEAELEQATPEEQAEFARLVDEANAVLPEMHATLDRMGDTLIGMSATIDEIREGMVGIDKRVTGIENHFGGVSASKPLPFRGGVGVGRVRKSNPSNSLTAPTPGSVPEGEG